jgi:uncharacterized protein DUF2252
VVRPYRERMAQYAEMPVFQVWYEHLDIEKMARELTDPERRASILKGIAKVRRHGIVEHDFPKLALARAVRDKRGPATEV